MNTADQARYAEATRKVEDVTTRYRLPLIAENILRNLSKSTQYPQNGVAFRGSVIVCGAGASLTKAIPYIRSARVPVIAVNNAAPALSKAGIPVDVLVSIESLDLSNHIREATSARTVVFDLMTHPAQWAAAEAAGSRVAWVLDASTFSCSIAYTLGVVPHQGGGFATATALELARLGGATEIILAGMDFGYSTKRECAEGSGWGGLGVDRGWWDVATETFTPDAAGDRLRFSGRPDRAEAHLASGVPPLPTIRPLYDLPAWGGEGTVPAVIEWVSQRDWIASWNRAVFSAGGGRMVNTSVLGSMIPGTIELPPESCIPQARGACWSAGQPADPARLELTREDLREQAKVAKAIAEHFTAGTPWPNMAALATPCQIVMSLAAHDLMAIGEIGGAPMAEVLRAQYTAIAAAAERVEGLL